MGSQYVHMAEVNTTIAKVGAIRRRFLSGQRDTPTPILKDEHKSQFHQNCSRIGMNHKEAYARSSRFARRWAFIFPTVFL